MNIQRNLVAATVLALGFAGAVPAIAESDSTVTVTHTTNRHHYVYYGDHEIYYAPETKTYYWRRDGNWTSGAELPAQSRGYVNAGGVELDLDTDHPYERHQWVVTHYRDRHDGDRSDGDGDGDDRHDADRRDGDDKHDGDKR